MVFERGAGDWPPATGPGNWADDIFIGDAVLGMTELGMRRPLTDVYEGVDFLPSGHRVDRPPA